MDQKHFRLILAEQLIGTYMSQKRAGRPRKRPRPLSSSSSIPTEHFPTYLSSVAVSNVGIFALSHEGKSPCGCVWRAKENNPYA